MESVIFSEFFNVDIFFKSERLVLTAFYLNKLSENPIPQATIIAKSPALITFALLEIFIEKSPFIKIVLNLHVHV